VTESQVDVFDSTVAESHVDVLDSTVTKNHVDSNVAGGCLRFCCEGGQVLISYPTAAGGKADVFLCVCVCNSIVITGQADAFALGVTTSQPLRSRLDSETCVDFRQDR
jgi:hypothetical protein